MIQINEEIAAKLSGKTAADLKALLFDGEGKLKDDAAQTFATLVTDKFREVERDRAENAYKRGIKEKAESIEAAIRPLLKKYGAEAEKVEDAINELSEKLKKFKPGEPGKPGKPEELTEDDISKLPAYQSLLDKDLAKARAVAADWEQKYNAYVADMQRKEVLSIARDRALTVLDEKGAVWGADKVKQLDYFFRVFGSDNLKVDEKGNPLPVDKDGNQLRDDSRNPVEFSDWVISNWKDAGYTFHDAPPNSGSAGARKHSEGGTGSKVIVTSPEQYNKLLDEAGADAKKASEIHAAYREFLQKAG